MTRRVSKRVDCSRIDNRFRSSLRRWKMPSPPFPSRGLMIISPPSLAMKSISWRIELVTRVDGMRSAK
jgi:hypothetical protein